MIYIVLAGIFLCGGVQAETAEQLFLAEKYEEALAAYETNNNPDATTLLHMSQCAHMAGQYTKSVLYSSRLLRQTAWRQYRQAAQHIVQVQYEAGYQRVVGFVWQITTACASVPLLLWQLLLLVAWLLLLVRGRRWFVAHKFKRLVCAIAVIGVLGYVCWWSYQERMASRAVAKDRVVVHTGPDERYAALTEVVPTTVLRVIGRDSSHAGETFYKVAAHGVRGWVAGSALYIV